MLKQRPTLYLALLAAVGGFLVVGVPVDRVPFLGLIGFMLMIYLGVHGATHGGHGRIGHEGHVTDEDPAGYGHVSPAPREHEVAGK